MMNDEPEQPDTPQEPPQAADGGWQNDADDDDQPPRQLELELVINIDGYEGPLDLLLTLAREQKVDLAQISILQLADQYLAFIARARHLRLEIAADYLVMAAWLAYLKSRLLLPQPEEEGELTGAELAEALAFHLQRLESMKNAGEKLFKLPQLGRDVFYRGAPEGIRVINTPVYEVSLHELLTAYADQRRRADPAAASLEIEAAALYSMDDALEWLRRFLPVRKDWQDLVTFLPPELAGDWLVRRSAMASAFAASLELVRDGRAEIRQHQVFGPIYVRPKETD